eukprot:12191444-Alexandrium_andersonii.AAC.1
MRPKLSASMTLRSPPNANDEPPAHPGAGRRRARGPRLGVGKQGHAPQPCPLVGPQSVPCAA